MTRRNAARSARLTTLPVAPEPDRLRTLLARRLALKLRGPVTLEITDNTYTMISFNRRAGTFHLRLHRMFLDATDDVVARLAAYIGNDDRAASRSLDRYIHEHRSQIRRVRAAERQKRLALKSTGRHHDLRALLASVAAYYRTVFGVAPGNVAIAWAPSPKVSVPRRSIKLGSYSADTQVVRIHPALDQPIVPSYFIRWIIFHELLHHHFRADLKARNGRVHTPEFYRLERGFPEFHDAILWERCNLDVLLWWVPGPTSVALRRTGT